MANELAKLVVRLEAQTAKYDASLKEATKQLRMFHSSTNSALNKLSAGFVSLGKRVLGLGAAFASVNSVLNAVKVGDDLAKAALKSGIAANAFTELAHAAKMTDVDLGSLSTALKKMQVTLSEAGSGGKAAEKTLAALGLSFEKIKALSPDQQFELIADRISQLQVPADKTRAAVELFGRAGADLLPLFEQGAEGIRKARLEAQQLGQSLSATDLKRFQEADDAINRMKASFEALSKTIALELGPAISRVADSMRSVFGGQTSSERLREELRLAELGVQSFGSMILDSPQGVMALERYNKALQEVADTEARRRAGMGRTIRSLGDPGEAPGFTDLDSEASKARIELLALGDPVSKLTAQFEAQRAKIADLVAKYPELSGVAGVAIKQITMDYVASVEAATQELRRFERQAETILSDIARIEAPLGFDQFADLERSINESMTKGAEESAKEIEASIERMSSGFKIAKDEMTVYAEQAARNMQDAFADFLFDPFDQGIKGMLRGFIDILRRMVAEILAAKALKGLAKVIEGILGGGKSGGGGGSGKAHGGHVSRGQLYTVGEKGPELFVPGMSGAIVPNGGMAPIQQINNIDARGATTDLIRALPEILAENNRRLAESLRDARSRGVSI